MQSNITQLKITGFYRTTLMVFALFCLLLGKINAQTYSNGPLSTGATSSNGIAAPAGTTWSEVQNPNINAGFAADITNNFTVADNFTVVGTWAITKMTFYAYSTGFAGTTSPFTDIRVQIYNTDPSVGSPAPIYGNLTTNRFLSSSFANMYRIFNATTGTTRKIWAIEANVNTSLTPGTYWVEWQVGNGGLSNFSPPVTVTGVATQPGWNGKQRTLPSTWAALTDAGGPQDMPFLIDYTTSACVGTPTPGNTVATPVAVCPGQSVALTLQNSTPGTGVTYQWQSASAVGGPYTNIAGATNASYTTTIAANTFYQAIVTCSGNSATSTPVQATLNAPSACYCTPPATNCNLDDAILNVTLGSSLNNTSACSSPSGYTNYTTTVAATNIIQGASNPMSVRVGPGGTEYVSVWIDYNKNGTFEASEFTALGSGNGSTINGNIIVPGTAPLGTTRMRVRVRFATANTGADACLGYTYGETEDYTVNLIACVQGVFNTQPANATAACGGTASFTVAATGSNIAYTWEYRTSATGTWLLVPASAPYSGQNTATLTITNATSALAGYQYRAMITGSCTAADFSAPASLSITPYLAPISPVPTVKCQGSSLHIFASPPPTVTTVCSPTLNTVIPDGVITGISNSMNVSGIPAGATINNISVKVNVTHAYVADLMLVIKAPNGKILNLSNLIGGNNNPGVNFTNTVFSSATGLPALASGTSPGYTGTFRPDAAPAVGAFGLPSGPTGFASNTTLFSDLMVGNLNGAWTIAMYDAGPPDQGTLVDWCINITWGVAPATGVFSPTTDLWLDAAGTIPYTGTAVNSVYTTTATSTTYSAVVSNGTCTSAPTPINVIVTDPLTTVTIPATTSVCEGNSTTITATSATGNPAAINYTWEVSTDGGVSWSTVSNGGVYSGATTGTLTINGAGSSLNNNSYRVKAAIPVCGSSVTSASTVLQVNPNPVIVVSANPFTALTPGMTTTLSAAVSPNPGTNYQWYRNGVLIPGATANTLVVDVDGLGEYTVTVGDANSCTSTSNSITIRDSSSNIVFIYPSPNTGQFQVRYYSLPGNTSLPRVLNVYDAKGSRVYTKMYPINAPYERLDVDLRNHGKGVYQVELSDRNGVRLKTGRVLIL